MNELIPWLYLKGISTGDFSEALQSLLGEDCPGLSANVVVRLKNQWSEEYDSWYRRDLTGKQYAYIWANGVHVNVRLEDDANKRHCIRVIIGATVDGQKELLSVVDGYGESERSWHEVLIGLKSRGLKVTYRTQRLDMVLRAGTCLATTDGSAVHPWLNGIGHFSGVPSSCRFQQVVLRFKHESPGAPPSTTFTPRRTS